MENQVFKNLKTSLEANLTFLRSLPETAAGHAYAPGKWTVAQLLQHVIDTERILAYRALSFARGEQTALPGFDENAYAALAPASDRTLASLTEEFEVVRRSTLLLFASFSPEMLARRGTANNRERSVEEVGQYMLWHADYHFDVVQERYLAVAS